MADIFRETQRSFLGIDLLADRTFTDNSSSASIKKTALSDTIKKLQKEDAEGNAEKIQSLQGKLEILEGYIKNKEYDKAFFDYNLDGNIGDDADQAKQTNDLEITEKSLEKQRFFNDYDRGTNIRMDHSQRLSILKTQISKEKDEDQKELLIAQRDILQSYIDTRDTDLYLDYNLDGKVDDRDEADKQQDIRMEELRTDESRFYHGEQLSSERIVSTTDMKRTIEDKIKEATNFQQRQDLEKQLEVLNGYIATRDGDVYLDYNLDGVINEADDELRASDEKLNDNVQRHFLGHKFSRDTFIDNDARLDALEALKKAEASDSGKDEVQAQIDQLNAYIEAGDQESIELDYNLDGVIDRRDELERENDKLRDDNKDTVNIEDTIEEEERAAQLIEQEERVENSIEQGNQAVQEVTDAFDGLLDEEGGLGSTQEASETALNTNSFNTITERMQARFMDLLTQLLLLPEDDPGRNGIISQLTAIQSLYDVQGVEIPGVDLDAILGNSSSSNTNTNTSTDSSNNSSNSGFTSPSTSTAPETVNNIINNRFVRSTLRTGFNPAPPPPAQDTTNTDTQATVPAENQNASGPAQEELPRFERRFNFSRGLIR